LGFSRVYVHLPEGFSYQAWVNGLKAGRSFVTNGPMLFATVNGQDPGYVFKSLSRTKGKQRLAVKGDALSAGPVENIELVVNGDVVRAIHSIARRAPNGAHQSHFEEHVELDGSGWIAVRCWEEGENGRFRFAHSAPWFVEVDGRPLRPRREEAEFLAKQVEGEIVRSSALLSSEAVEEYQRALSIYRDIARTAK